MQRRKVEGHLGGSDNGGLLNSSPSKASGRRSMLQQRRSGGSARTSAAAAAAGSGSMRLVLVILVLVCLLIGTTMYVLPSQKITRDLVDNAYNLEQEMKRQFGDFLQQGKASNKFEQHAAATANTPKKDASKAMKEQPSSWVDGEKKLKQKLQVLWERQRQGKDLGVPVLTRYLGEDFPAWPIEGMDEKEWRAQVDAKYKEMAEEEQKWRLEMKKMDERNQKQR